MQTIRATLGVKHLAMAIAICAIGGVLAMYYLSQANTESSAPESASKKNSEVYKIVQDDGTVIYLSGKQVESNTLPETATEVELPEIHHHTFPTSSKSSSQWWLYLVPLPILGVWYFFLGGQSIVSRTWPGRQQRQRTQVYLECVLGMLSKLCELDGLKCQAEKESVDYFIKNRMNMGLETQRFAKEIFEAADHSKRTFDSYLLEFARVFKDDYHLRYLLLQILSEVANADGDFSAEEEELLRRISKQLGLEAHFFTGEQRRRQSEGSSTGSYSYSTESTKSKFYQVLGCSPDASEKEVKKAYRKLVLECHPDRLIARGMPEEFISVARERFLKVQEAYEEIVKGSG